jgi:hypothetical protein
VQCDDPQCAHQGKWLHLVCDGVLDPARQRELADPDSPLPYLCSSCCARKDKRRVAAPELNVGKASSGELSVGGFFT